MSKSNPPRDSITCEELMLWNVWQVEGLITVLERKGIINKQEVLDIVHELCQKHPSADGPQ